MAQSRREARHRAIVLSVLAAFVAIMIAVFARREATPEEIARAAAQGHAALAREAAQQTSQATPRPVVTPRDTRMALVFARSMQPASRVIVRSGTRETMTDTAARIEPPPASEPLTIIDAETSLTLLQLEKAGELPTILELPEPVRLAGKLTRADGSRADKATIRWGSGEGVTPDERQRRETGSRIRPAPNEDRPWGIPLAPSPAAWETLQPGPDGGFTSPWFLATGAEPQLVAYDMDGRWAAMRFPWPDAMPPRATLDAGTLALADPAVLEVEVEFPPGEIAADMGLGIREASVLPEHEGQAGLLLGLLDRLNPELGAFARGSGNIAMVKPGLMRFAPMPPLSQVTIIARGAVAERTPTRLVDFEPGKTTRIKFSAADLFPIGGATRRIEATLVLEGTETPAEGVRVSFSGWRQHEEQISDARGRVAFAAVPSESPATFQIDAFDERDPPRFSKSWTEDVLRAMEGTDPTATVRVKWNVPTFRWIMLPRDGMTGRGLPGGEPILAIEESLDGGKTWKPGDVADSEFSDDELWIEVTRPGLYRVTGASGPLVVRRSQLIPMGPGDFQIDGEWDADSLREPKPLRVRFLGRDGKPLASASVLLFAHQPGAQPLELETDADGWVTANECNMETVRAQITSGDHTESITIKVENGTSIANLKEL